MMSNKAVSFIISWITFNVLLTAALLVNRYLYFEEYMEETLSVTMVLELLAQIILLTVTGFIIFGFLKVVLRDWFRRKDNASMFLILIFYVAMIVSYLLTFIMAFKELPREVMIDAPLMIAVATLVLGIIPYFRKNFFAVTS